jgi:hypothetical protein
MGRGQHSLVPNRTGAAGSLTDPFRSLVEPLRGVVPALDRVVVQLNPSATNTREVKPMAKKDDGHREAKKGKESER